MPSSRLTTIGTLRLGALLVIAALAASSWSAATAVASPRTGPAVVVSMGDSYIVGAAGRWKGNSLTDTGSKNGTDRACVPGPRPGTCASYDVSKIYPDGTTAAGCARSDSAEVLSAKIPGIRGVNLACGGAVTANVIASAQGGKPQNKGQRTQADVLATVAKKQKVRMIVVSVGGNDDDAGGVVASCAFAYANLGPASACSAAKTTALAKIAPSTKALERTVASIRGVMRHAGYTTSNYRLVLQDYDIGVPPANQVRYPQSDETDRFNDGCPLANADLTFIRSKLEPRLTTMVKTAAAHEHAELLDVSNLFDRHEICSIHDSLVPPGGHPSAAKSEWIRFLSLPHVLAQAPPIASDFAEGEMLHPSYYAQQALGVCLRKVAEAAAGQHTCTTPGGGTKVRLTTKPTPSGAKHH